MREGYVEGATEYLAAHLKRCQAGEYRAPSGYPAPEAESLAGLCDVLADLHRLAENRAGVVAAYRMAIGFSPRFVEGHMSLGKALFDAGEPAEGMRHLQTAARLAPQSAEVQTDYGVALARYGRLDAAIGQFQRVLSRNPDYAPARQYLQRALEQAGGKGELRSGPESK